ncbi:MAG TPA: MFS transporter, partial [Anaerolineae bacterium]|nr:MFS transporter [Anaerolineae bacterium]
LALFGLGFFVSSFTPQQPVPWYSSEAMVAELSQRGEAPSEQLALLPEETQPGVAALTYALLALLPLGIGYALLSPSINSLITKRTNSHQIGRALGLGAAFMSAGTAIGPSLGGILFNSFGPAAPYLINGLVTGLLLLIAFQRLTPEPGDVATELVRSSS